MSSNKTLAGLASALLSGSVRVVDLSAPLGPDTPVIYLPPNIGKNTPPVKVHPISKYDALHAFPSFVRRRSATARLSGSPIGGRSSLWVLLIKGNESHVQKQQAIATSRAPATPDQARTPALCRTRTTPFAIFHGVWRHWLLRSKTVKAFRRQTPLSR